MGSSNAGTSAGFVVLINWADDDAKECVHSTNPAGDEIGVHQFKCRTGKKGANLAGRPYASQLDNWRVGVGADGRYILREEGGARVTVVPFFFGLYYFLDGGVTDNWMLIIYNRVPWS